MTSRLKSLELQGYKTFASKTLLEFPADITAVVGPNGAGKSNVADAVRWVLGEQSYSLLRGRKTEDMIFAGSEQRSRASMASATITLDNQDGWLPIDYSEVSLTRRAYRDGQNEYLLNGQRVRLKEINELLAQSGLSERTYTIIGQGLVDTALSLKPDERRKFFEEAAGIGLYRGRREESLNRLESTQRNLDRVKDILSELEPRLRSLERQAKRTQEYEHIKADLQLLLRDWYGFHWHRAQRELVQVREFLRTQESKAESARKKLHEVDKTLEGARLRLQGLRSDLNQWHGQSSDLHQQREKISRQLAVMDERQRAAQDQQQSARSELLRLEEEFRMWQERTEGIKEQKAHLLAELSEAQLQIDSANKALKTRQTQRDQVEKTLREARRELVSFETRQVQLKAHQNEISNRSDSLIKSLQSIQQSIDNETKLLETAESKLKQTIRMHEQAQLESEEAEEESQIIRRSIDELERERKKAVDERSRFEADYSRIKAQLDVLIQAEKSFSGLNQGARFILQSAKQGQLPGQYKPLSSLLVVPAEYEIAVAAVLGEYLDGVLLDSETDPENALILLEKGEKGRAVLFSPVSGSQVEPIVVSKTDQVLGVASEFIKSPEPLSSLIHQLLGNVVLVQDRKTAKLIRKTLPASAQIVTLKGEIFAGNGVIIAGRDGRSGMIARPRQKQELEDLLVELDDKLDDSEKKIKNIERDLETKQSDYQRKAKELQQFKTRLNETSQGQQRARLELDQIRQRSDWQHKQLVSTETQISKAQEENKKLEKELENISEQISRANQDVRAKSGAFAELNLDELQSQVAHWSTNVAVSSRAVKDIEHRDEEYGQNLKQNLGQQQGIQQKQQNFERMLLELENEKAIHRGQEIKLNKSIEDLQAVIDPAEKELQDLEQHYSVLQENQAAAQQTVSIAERYLSQAQLDVTRQREGLDALRRRIEDDFGLVAFEYSTNVSGQTPLPLGEMVEQLPMLEEIHPELEENINRQRAMLRRMGAINPEALNEFQSVSERYNFLITQVEDLKQADADLRSVINELDDLMKREFRKTFDAVAAEFKQMFTRLFAGGSARLVLLDEENPIQAGIDIEAKLPGRREQGLSLLSGGERSLTAVALIFSLLKVSPTPFCILDEVDAALDEANVGRFCELLSDLSERTQFIVITHNRNTVQTAGVIYGVTMNRDSASQLISLKLDEIGEDMVRQP